MKKLGIAGGLGPLASALFYRRLTQLTQAATDQEHIELVICSAPRIPDRSAYICGKSSESPLDGLLKVCSTLGEMSDVIAMTCITAHHFYDELAAAVSVPILDMHRICAEETAPAPLGIMATDGTVVSGRLQSILRENGIKPVLPRDQASVMRLIYGVKQGKPLDIDAFHAETLALAAQGAENILLACTELSVYTETDIYNGASPPLYDALDLLARRCIKAVGGNVIDQRP